MAKTLKATYESAMTVDNVVFDLVGTGIPRDQITTDKDKNQVEVVIGKAAEPEIRELLERHQPKSLG